MQIDGPLRRCQSALGSTSLMSAAIQASMIGGAALLQAAKTAESLCIA
jgi:hypothetical protein